MKMRDLIDLCEKTLLPTGWNLGGSWITDAGEVLKVDHSEDLHHSDIALAHFATDDMRDDDGDYDDYSRDMTQEIAYSEGWIRVSTDGVLSLSVEWHNRPTDAALKSLFSIIQNDHTPYKEYNVTAPSHPFEQFSDVKTFVRFLRSILRK